MGLGMGHSGASRQPETPRAPQASVDLRLIQVLSELPNTDFERNDNGWRVYRATSLTRFPNEITATPSAVHQGIYLLMSPEGVSPREFGIHISHRAAQGGNGWRSIYFAEDGTITEENKEQSGGLGPEVLSEVIKHLTSNPDRIVREFRLRNVQAADLEDMDIPRGRVEEYLTLIKSIRLYESAGARVSMFDADSKLPLELVLENSPGNPAMLIQFKLGRIRPVGLDYAEPVLIGLTTKPARIKVEHPASLEDIDQQLQAMALLSGQTT